MPDDEKDVYEAMEEREEMEDGVLLEVHAWRIRVVAMIWGGIGGVVAGLLFYAFYG